MWLSAALVPSDLAWRIAVGWLVVVPNRSVENLMGRAIRAARIGLAWWLITAAVVFAVLVMLGLFSSGVSLFYAALIGLPGGCVGLFRSLFHHERSFNRSARAGRTGRISHSENYF